MGRGEQWWMSIESIWSMKYKNSHRFEPLSCTIFQNQRNFNIIKICFLAPIASVRCVQSWNVIVSRERTLRLSHACVRWLGNLVSFDFFAKTFFLSFWKVQNCFEIKVTKMHIFDHHVLDRFVASNHNNRSHHFTCIEHKTSAPWISNKKDGRKQAFLNFKKQKVHACGSFSIFDIYGSFHKREKFKKIKFKRNHQISLDWPTQFDPKLCWHMRRAHWRVPCVPLVESNSTLRVQTRKSEISSRKIQVLKFEKRKVQWKKRHIFDLWME